MGGAQLQHGRFPLLIKILDAQEKLSLQVHPPPKQAIELGGEPKTELWFITDAAPGAELYVGLSARYNGSDSSRGFKPAPWLNVFIAWPCGPAMLCFAQRSSPPLGAGLVLFEIQQNSIRPTAYSTEPCGFGREAPRAAPCSLAREH